jgi:hypothetical protein
MTLTSKKYFQKIMLIYVNLLCIKYHLIKSHGVTRQNLGLETHQYYQINYISVQFVSFDRKIIKLPKRVQKLSFYKLIEPP